MHTVKKQNSSGQGVIPYWRYSPRACNELIRLNSEANSIVWMKEEKLLDMFYVSIRQLFDLYLCPELLFRIFLF